MTIRRATGTVILFAIILAASQAGGQVKWTPEAGYGDTKHRPMVEVDSLIAHYNNCVTLFEQKRYKECRRLAKSLIKNKRFRNSPLLESLMYYRASGYYAEGHLVRALNAFEDLIQSYPDTVFMVEVLHAEFEISKCFVEGSYKLKILGIPFGLKSRGRRQIEKLLERAPYSTFAAEAHFLLAQDLYKNKDYLGAEIEFRAIPKSYPQSVYARQAMLARAKCLLASATGPAYDSSPARDAEFLLRDYRRDYPKETKPDENLAGSILKARELQAAHVFEIAEFYRKKKKIQAAEVYYRKVLKEFPESASFSKALARLRQEGLEVNP